MTALDEYDRLEAVGILKRSGMDEGTEVVVTFGEATLTMNALSETGDTPISHWSLAAIDLVSETNTKAVYSLSAMTEETLEVEDITFRTAIARVLRDQKIAPITPKRPKTILYLACSIAALGVGYMLLPTIMTAVSKSMISPERAQLLTNEMLPMIEARTGPACETDAGRSALDELTERLNPDGGTTLVVHDLGDTDVISLPGGTILINRTVVETADEDEILAWIAIGIASVIESPAISELFASQGILDGLQFLSSGQLTEPMKAQAVNRLLTPNQTIEADIVENARQLLVNAQVTTRGLADIQSEDTTIANNGQSETVIGTQSWSALRNICTG